MKDNIQNIADLIGALAEDIEEIKKKLNTKDSSDKDEELKRLEVKLQTVIQFFNGNAPKNIDVIFGSQEAIEEYRKSLGNEMVVCLQAEMEATEKDRRKRGVPSIKEQFDKILELLKSHIESERLASEKSQPKQGFMTVLWQAVRPVKMINAIKLLWSKIPDGWYKNPYAWTGIGFTLVFFALFTLSWIRWHDYRDENRRLRTVADKHQVTTVMLDELYPELAVTIGAYEKLTETVGVDSTLTIFRDQVKTIKQGCLNKAE